METLNNKGLNNAIKILTICVVAALLAIGFIIFKADALSLSVFVAFALFYVQIPGLLVVKAMGVKFSHMSTTLCTGLFTGWFLVIIEYFISELIHTDLLLLVAGPVLTVIYAVMCFRKERSFCLSGFNFSSLSTALCIFAVLAFYYAIATTQYHYMNPEYSRFVYMNPDKAFHMGLVDTLSHGWPMESPWASGIKFKYHVFMELLYSVPVRLFNITADVAIFSFHPLMTTYSFVLSSYVFYREMLNTKKAAGLCCLAVILSNIFLVRSIDNSLALGFALTNDGAVGFGISTAMLTVVLMKYWYSKFVSHEPQVHMFILLLAVLMLATGIKGPIAVVLVAAAWGTYVLGLILRKVPAKAILPLIILTAGFLFTYVNIIGLRGTTNGNDDSIIALATIANITFYHGPLIAAMKALGLPKIIRLGIMLVVFMIFMLTAFVIPFTAGYIRELFMVFSGRKEYDYPRVLVYAAFLVGLIAMMILNYGGHSQVYFGFVSTFFAPLIAFWFLEDMKGSKSALIKAVWVIFLVSLVFTTITLGMHFVTYAKTAADYADTTTEYPIGKSMSHSEYEAMMWLHDNTPKDSLLATDRYSSVPMEEYSYENRWANRFFLYAAYSNRFCYIAGSGYNIPDSQWKLRRDMIETNSKMYDVSNPARGDLARSLGVDYVVVSKRFTDIDSLENEDYKLCFSNDHVDIYEISEK